MQRMHIMARRKPKSPIEGRWNIISMTEWDEESLIGRPKEDKEHHACPQIR
jgi:hypothetical protein